MSEQNKQISLKFMELAWRKRDFAALHSVMTADAVSHGPTPPSELTGPEASQAFVSAYVAGFPDVNYTVESQEADGDMVMTWVTFTGTHTGTLMNIPPTGRAIRVPVKVTDRIANGKIVESWAEWDPQDMMRQLGVG
jgi:steroid delta-isomerase-like uncharacterized protein